MVREIGGVSYSILAYANTESVIRIHTYIKQAYQPSKEKHAAISYLKVKSISCVMHAQSVCACKRRSNPPSPPPRPAPLPPPHPTQHHPPVVF